jgi:hypothetical protein
MLMLFFWVIMLCGLVGRYQCYGETVYIFSHEDEGGVFLQNIGMFLHVQTTSQPRTTTLTNSLLIMRIVFTTICALPRGVYVLLEAYIIWMNAIYLKMIMECVLRVQRIHSYEI